MEITLLKIPPLTFILLLITIFFLRPALLQVGRFLFGEEVEGMVEMPEKMADGVRYLLRYQYEGKDYRVRSRKYRRNPELWPGEKVHIQFWPGAYHRVHLPSLNRLASWAVFIGLLWSLTLFLPVLFPEASLKTQLGVWFAFLLLFPAGIGFYHLSERIHFETEEMIPGWGRVLESISGNDEHQQPTKFLLVQTTGTFFQEEKEILIEVLPESSWEIGKEISFHYWPENPDFNHTPIQRSHT